MNMFTCVCTCVCACVHVYMCVYACTHTESNSTDFQLCRARMYLVICSQGNSMGSASQGRLCLAIPMAPALK